MTARSPTHARFIAAVTALCGAAVAAGGCSNTGLEERIGSECGTDAACANRVPVTTPLGCAAAVCQRGVCKLVARDLDGDGHASNYCKSTTGEPIVEGDDCNDADPALYPGHPRECPAGIPGCAPGQVSCLPDGHESACVSCVRGQVSCCEAQPVVCDDASNWTPNGDPCASQVCQDGSCVGECVAGAARCSGQQPQRCDDTNHWLPPDAPCQDQVCLGGSCVGECAPGTTQCSPPARQIVTQEGVATCSSSGRWEPPVACLYGTCTDGNCTGECWPGATQCAGASSVRICGPDALWPDGTPWTCATATCINSACAGAIATAPSCTSPGAGLTDCGGSSESCCTSVEIPGGTFERSYGATSGTGGSNPATIAGLLLDKYLVTVGRFRRFVAAWNGGWSPPVASGKHAHLNGGQGLNDTGAGPVVTLPLRYESGWSSTYDGSVAPTDKNLACDPTYADWTSSPGDNERLPVNCVNWYEAYAFCIWDQGFLPSFWEATYAAAGGVEQRSYPWGSMQPGRANGYAIYGCLYPGGTDAGACIGASNIAPVGTAPQGAGKWGQLDLDGELFQWTLDTSATVTSPCVDCTDLSSNLSGSRTTTSTGFGNPASDLLLPRIASGAPTARGYFIGFRCARAP